MGLVLKLWSSSVTNLQLNIIMMQTANHSKCSMFDFLEICIQFAATVCHIFSIGRVIAW